MGKGWMFKREKGFMLCLCMYEVHYIHTHVSFPSDWFFLIEYVNPTFQSTLFYASASHIYIQTCERRHISISESKACKCLNLFLVCADISTFEHPKRLGDCWLKIPIFIVKTKQIKYRYRPIYFCCFLQIRALAALQSDNSNP